MRPCLILLVALAGPPAVYGAWIAMLAVHEAGHVLHAWLSGGQVRRVVIPLVGFSETDVSPNPSPLFVAWGRTGMGGPASARASVRRPLLASIGRRPENRPWIRRVLPHRQRRLPRCRRPRARGRRAGPVAEWGPALESDALRCIGYDRRTLALAHRNAASRRALNRRASPDHRRRPGSAGAVRERMGIEPTKDHGYGLSAVLKTVRPTRRRDAPRPSIITRGRSRAERPRAADRRQRDSPCPAASATAARRAGARARTQQPTATCQIQKPMRGGRAPAPTRAARFRIASPARTRACATRPAASRPGSGRW